MYMTCAFGPFPQFCDRSISQAIYSTSGAQNVVQAKKRVFVKRRKHPKASDAHQQPGLEKQSWKQYISSVHRRYLKERELVYYLSTNNRNVNLAVKIAVKTEPSAATQTTMNATIENTSTGRMYTRLAAVELTASSPTVEYPGFGSHFKEKSLAPPRPKL
jgi:hypothetical protein